MHQQANRQSQPSPAKKPGALMSCLCASALNRCSKYQRDRYPDHSHGDGHTVTRPAPELAMQSAGEQVPGMGKPVTLSTCARVNPAGKGPGLRREGKPGPDPVNAQIVRSVCSAAQPKCMIYKQSALATSQFDILGIVRIIQITLNRIRHLQRGAGIMDPDAVQQVQRNKGARTRRRSMGIRHQDRPGTVQPWQDSRGISVYQSGSYAVQPSSMQCARHASRPAIRRTPGGQVKFPILQTDRRQGGAPQ